MGCFLVPAAEAVVTTVAAKVMETKEKDNMEKTGSISFSEKVGWLNKMLWGGSALLAFEHLWHGEIVPSFPFLTAAETGELAELFEEMSTTGVLMAVLVTLVWIGMVIVSGVIEKKADETKAAKEVK